MIRKIHGPLALMGAAALALLAATTQEGRAAAFFLQEQSTRGIGRANAGSAAVADDATTIFFNPAGLTELSEPQAAVGAHLLMPQADVGDRGSTAATPGTRGAALPYPGARDGDPYDPQPTGNAYVAAPLAGGRVWAGLGAGIPFGLRSDYGRDWFGRYDSVESELLTVNIAPTVAVALNERISIGGGIDVQYADATLVNAIPNPAAPGGPSPATDALFRVEGDDWSVGFNVGLLLKPTPTTRVGVHYRSGIDHDLSGDVQLSGLAGPLAALNGSTTASAEVKLPDITTLAVAQELTPRLTLLGQVSRFGWDRFEILRIETDDGRPDVVSTENYRNTWTVALGAEYALTEAWTLRGGVQYDETPTRDGFRSTRVPDGDRFWTALGASFAPSERIAFDVAYAHLFVEDGEIDLTRSFFDEVPALRSSVRINAVSENSVDILSAQLRVRF
jgi:long-chain fatty acid transport protein